MNSTSASLVVLKGLFQNLGGDTKVFPEGSSDPVLLSEKLSPLIGRSVEFLVHHLPRNGNVDPTRAGGGSCMVGPYCRAGHAEDPAFLYSLKASGVLGCSPEGIWAVDAKSIPLESNMNGHYGQLVVFAEGVRSTEVGTSDLLAEATSLIETLSALRRFLKVSS